MKVTLKSNTLIEIMLKESETEKFEAVKKYMGLRQNMEVVRALICEKYGEIRLLEEKQSKQEIAEAKAMELLEKGEYKCCIDFARFCFIFGKKKP
jgi:hypothetical protein